MNKKIILFAIISLSYCSKDGPRLTSSTLAVVNDRTITTEQFSEQAQSIRNTPGIDLSSKDGRINILRDMINEELVFQEALKDEFHLKNLKIKHEIVKDYLQQTFGKTIPDIKDEQIKSFYEKNKDAVDMIRVSHILIKPTNKDDEKAKLAAKTKLEGIQKDITQGKISFGDAAARYSDDNSKEVGGDLGYFGKGKMVAPFEQAAFGLHKMGDLSSVVETEYGYHLIMLTADQRGLDANKERIRWKLYQDTIQPIIDAYFNKLKGKAKIKISDNDIMNIPVPNT